jgi:Ca2+-binding RTX toxin-like protein
MAKPAGTSTSTTTSTAAKTSGGSRDTYVSGTKNADVMTHDGVRDLKTGGGNDSVTGAEKNFGKTVYLEDGDDTFQAPYYGTASDDKVDAGKGNDKLNLGSGNDRAWGGDGADTFNGGPGNDTMTGGSGADLYSYQYGREYSYEYDPETYSYTSKSKVVGTDGIDTVTDFSTREDDLLLTSNYYEPATADEVLLKNTGDGTYVTFEGGGGVLLPGVHGYNHATQASDWLHY